MLHKMRSKSDATKNKLALILALTSTLIIVGVWTLVIKNSKTDEIVKENSTAEDLRPLSLIFQNAKSGINDIRANAKALKEEKEKAAAAAAASEEPAPADVVE